MGNTHKQAIDSSTADKHVNNGSVWIGKRACVHTYTLSDGEKSTENTSFPLGILRFVILNCTLNVLSGVLIHYHLKTNLPTGYISSERSKDTLTVHRPSADHHSR